MLRLAPLVVVALLMPTELYAGSFGIDFSPLREPGFGKRRDYEIVDVNGGSASASRAAKPTAPRRPSPEMTRLRRTLDRASESLTKDIIAIPKSELPGGSARFQVISATYGDTIFNVATGKRELFSVPVDYRPRIKPVEERLSAAAAMVRAAAADESLSNEDRAFLAGQAVFALEGQPLQVVVEQQRRPPPPPAAVERVRNAWANVVTTLTEVQAAQLERRAAEPEAVANPVSITAVESEEREQAKQRIHQRYQNAIKAEQAAKEKLRVARTELTEAVQVIQGDIVIRD